MLILQPAYWPLAIVCGIAAASPDLMWLPTFIRDYRKQKAKPLNAIMKFHAKIQWAEKPENVVYELAWFLPALFLLVKAV